MVGPVKKLMVFLSPGQFENHLILPHRHLAKYLLCKDKSRIRERLIPTKRHILPHISWLNSIVHRHFPVLTEGTALLPSNQYPHRTQSISLIVALFLFVCSPRSTT
jgi:hypothetical protein